MTTRRSSCVLVLPRSSRCAPWLTARVSQPLQVPIEKLYVAFERALVNVVNDVGVMINDTVTDAYQQNVLPFVAGLGPRKATKLVRDIIKNTSVGPPFLNLLQPSGG